MPDRCAVGDGENSEYTAILRPFSSKEPILGSAIRASREFLEAFVFSNGIRFSLRCRLSRDKQLLAPLPLVRKISRIVGCGSRISLTIGCKVATFRSLSNALCPFLLHEWMILTIAAFSLRRIACRSSTVASSKPLLWVLKFSAPKATLPSMFQSRFCRLGKKNGKFHLLLCGGNVPMISFVG